jgi:hypothetical protein
MAPAPVNNIRQLLGLRRKQEDAQQLCHIHKMPILKGKACRLPCGHVICKRCLKAFLKGEDLKEDLAKLQLRKEVRFEEPHGRKTGFRANGILVDSSKDQNQNQNHPRVHTAPTSFQPDVPMAFAAPLPKIREDVVARYRSARDYLIRQDEIHDKMIWYINGMRLEEASALGEIGLVSFGFDRGEFFEESTELCEKGRAEVRKSLDFVRRQLDGLRT